jgi:hypothetical protein
MALIQQDAHRQTEPACFGKSWDPKSPLCMGGIDTTYTNRAGEHVREPCRFQPTCSIRCTVNAQAHQPQQPTRSLPILPASSSMASQPGWRQPTYPQQTTSYAQVHQLQQPTPYAMPQFLPVREPLEVPRGKRFLIEVLRSIGMAFGHTIANFFAHESFSSHDPNKRQP